MVTVDAYNENVKDLCKSPKRFLKRLCHGIHIIAIAARQKGIQRHPRFVSVMREFATLRLAGHASSQSQKSRITVNGGQKGALYNEHAPFPRDYPQYN
jgi:hypothetical protein